MNKKEKEWNRVSKSDAIAKIIDSLLQLKPRKLGTILNIIEPKYNHYVYNSDVKICSSCDRNPAEKNGDMCYQCLCGMRSGCPAKYGQRGVSCPHDWCPNGGVSPE